MGKEPASALRPHISPLADAKAGIKFRDVLTGPTLMESKPKQRGRYFPFLFGRASATCWSHASFFLGFVDVPHRGMLDMMWVLNGHFIEARHPLPSWVLRMCISCDEMVAGSQNSVVFWS